MISYRCFVVLSFLITAVSPIFCNSVKSTTLPNEFLKEIDTYVQAKPKETFEAENSEIEKLLDQEFHEKELSRVLKEKIQSGDQTPRLFILHAVVVSQSSNSEMKASLEKSSSLYPELKHLIDSFHQQLLKGQQKRVVMDIGSIGTALAGYEIDTKNYPIENGDIAKIAKELDIKWLPAVDVWGNAIEYYSDGQTYWIISLGADGKKEEGLYNNNGIPLKDSVGKIDDSNGDLIYSNGMFWRSPNPEILLKINADEYFAKKDYTSALDLYKELHRKIARRSREIENLIIHCYYNLGVSEMKNGKCETALGYFDEVQWNYTYFSDEKTSQVSELAKRCIKAGPADPSIQKEILQLQLFE